MKDFIPVFNFTILVVLILNITLLDKPKPTWIPSNYLGYEWNTPGLDTLPSEKTTLSGTSINYSFNAFGIGYTTSTQTIDDSDVMVKKVVVSWICLLWQVYKILLFRHLLVGYSLIIGIIPAMTRQQILLKGGSGFFNVGVDLGLFELTGGYRVWSIVHNVNLSRKNSNGNTQTSDDKDHLAYKEMYLGLGYIFWSKLTSWKIDKQSNLC